MKTLYSLKYPVSVGFICVGRVRVLSSVNDAMKNVLEQLIVTEERERIRRKCEERELIYNFVNVLCVNIL